MRAYLAHRDRLLTIDRVDDTNPVASERLVGDDVECVAAHPEVPDRAFVGTFDAGLHRTTDGAATIEPIGSAVESDAVTAVAVSPHDPDEVWVGTEPSRLYRSRDGGDSFDPVGGLTEVPSADEWAFPPRPHTHHVRWIEPDPTDRGRLYVGIEAGALCYTTDVGEGLDGGRIDGEGSEAVPTWIDRPPGSRRDNHQLATHPDASGRVYSAAGDGYAESTDGGESWSVLHDGLGHRYVWSVLPDPGDPDRVLVTAATGPGSAHSPPGESYCYRGARAGNAGPQDDNGLEWERLAGPISGEGVLRGVLATDGEPGHAFAATNRGCYRSTDFGSSWTRLDVEWPDALREQTARGLAVVPE